MIIKYLTISLCFFLISCSSKNWREASRESVGIAPLAKDIKEDIVQVYYARAFSWRGNIGVHPWIAWKKKDDEQYTVSQVNSWNLRRENTTVSTRKDLPDRKWYDNDPYILFEARGVKASKIITQLEPLITNYPFKDTYNLWPGPNSNTFISYLIRNIDEIDIELPPTAIGKDYLGNTKFISNTPSNTGFTVSLLGALGFTIGAAEGIEVNLLGLHFGIDLWTPAVKLPFFGRVGFKDKGL